MLSSCVKPNDKCQVMFVKEVVEASSRRKMVAQPTTDHYKNVKEPMHARDMGWFQSHPWKHILVHGLLIQPWDTPL